MNVLFSRSGHGMIGRRADHPRAWRLGGSVVLAIALLAGLTMVAQRSWGRTDDVALEQLAVQVDIQISVDEIVAAGFASPVLVTHAGDGSNRLFVVEKAGYIRIIKEGGVLPTPFLNITGIVDSGAGERGLLGLAFDPDYENNGLFYVNYTRTGDGEEQGDTVVARYTVSDADPDVADPDSAAILLVVDQPYANHNGGNLVFGPDGYLYIGLGDGGSAGDPDQHGQDNTTLLGAMLRIGVGQGVSYTIPLDNPYVGAEGADEVLAIGLRNPWRFSFDRETGDLYIADVGQNAWEEVDFLVAGTAGGANLGWPCREGAHTFSDAPPCDDPDWLATLTEPIAEYGHDQGRSVTGGFVYRGSDYPSLAGRYFYADFVEGKIWSIDTTTWSPPELELDTSLTISSFGEDERGELYVVDYGGGTVRRLTGANNMDHVRYLPLVLR